MHINIETDFVKPQDDPKVGNVYPCRGGRNLKYGYMMILIAVNDSSRMCYFVLVDKQGDIVGVNSYAMHYVEDLSPIAFVPGIDSMEFTMRSL